MHPPSGARAGSRTLNLGIKSQSTSGVMVSQKRQGVSSESGVSTQLCHERQGVSSLTVKLSYKLSLGGTLTHRSAPDTQPTFSPVEQM